MTLGPCKGSHERVADLRVVTHGRVLGPWVESHVGVPVPGPDMESAGLSQLLTHLLISIGAIVRDSGQYETKLK